MTRTLCPAGRLLLVSLGPLLGLATTSNHGSATALLTQDGGEAVAEAPAPYFPPSTALGEGLSPEALARLDELVQGFVDNEDIVGAELLVVKNGKSVLHEAYGWSDIEAGREMEVDSVFCVRSMTKPLVGTAALMLIDDKQMKLDDPVLKYLPAFDVEGSRDITIEHLLTHTSGLPMSLIFSTDLTTLDGIQEVAGMGAGLELDFPPGTNIQYSDQGTDTLTAVVEVVSGMSAAAFVESRILEPLGMQDSATVMTEGHPLRERAASKYVGAGGTWTEFWNREKPPLFPFFLGSQGLYSTLEDYARFLQLWKRKGRSSEERLLGARYVRKALTPSPFDFGTAVTALPGLEVSYGYLMELWMEPGEVSEDGEAADDQLIAFGHTGSDGTHAWCFPEENAMVLYFTQTRGTMTGLRVEEALGELLLGTAYDPMQDAPPLDDYLGYYYEGGDDLYRAIIRDGDDLALEILGKAVVPLGYMGDDRWKLKPRPDQVVEFDRDEEGRVVGYHIGEHVEYRLEPDADLPNGDDLAQRAFEVHGLARLEELGPLHLQGSLAMEKAGMSGTFELIAEWPNRFRVDVALGPNFEHTAFDGETVTYASSMEDAGPLEGDRAEQVRRDNFLARFGDLRLTRSPLTTIQRIQRDSKDVYVVRAGDTSATASTLYIGAESGRLLRESNVTHVPGAGRLGTHASFGDFREIEGMWLPHRTEVEFGNAMLGALVSQTESLELGTAVDDGVYEIHE